jgi:hypothetical protein
MRTKSSKTLIALASAAAFWAAAVPAHASPMDVIRDCSEDGKLNRHYTAKELGGALRRLPSDLDEYTDCRGIIRRAQLAGANKGSKGILGKVDTVSPPTPKEQEKLDKATKTRPGPVAVGGRAVLPGAEGASSVQLPAFVLAALIGLGGLVLSGGGLAFQRRWPDATRRAADKLSSSTHRVLEGVKRGISRFRG